MSIILSHNTMWVITSTFILGLASGLLGCLAYWKRQSLMSDALSHAALPGVVIAFALLGYKNLPVMIIGAAISALIGAFFVQWIRSSTRIKEDTAMGIILSVFFGFGIMLLTLVNRSVGGGQSGLNSFIFGQAASMVRTDVYTMVAMALLVIIVVALAFKEWKLYLFDPAFAQGLGLPGKWMNAAYTLLLVLVIVIGIQAVGVILMSALLIIPAVSARYWTYSFKMLLILSAIFGGLSGAVGTFISAMGKGWPTGPFIVVTAAALFFFSLLFGSKKGIVSNWLTLQNLQKEYEPETAVVVERSAVRRG